MKKGERHPSPDFLENSDYVNHMNTIIRKQRNRYNQVKPDFDRANTLIIKGG